MQNYYIGTSGWVYKDWKGLFYPEDLSQSQWLKSYSSIFKTVEINSTFYRLPTEKTIKKWAQETPTDFHFSVKLNRYATHLKKLEVEKEDLVRFVSPFYDLGHKLGPILIQIPPFLTASPDRLVKFVNNLPSGYKYAFEPRNESWLSPVYLNILKAKNIALVITELSQTPQSQEKTANFGYIRLHGSPSHDYLFKPNELRDWADRLKGWSKNWEKTYIYFNNDVHGYAPKNALELEQFLRAGYGKNRGHR